jgi:uncharacterized protein YjbJ (UPF0337 family)
MDKDRIKGKVDEVAGRAKRQAGEWTGDSRTQVEGGIQELKGRAENAWGKVKDEARKDDETDTTAESQHRHDGRQ